MNEENFLSLTYNKILSLTGFMQLHRHSKVVIDLSINQIVIDPSKDLNLPVPSLLLSVTNGVTVLPATHTF